MPALLSARSGGAEDDVRGVTLTVLEPEEQAGRKLDVFCESQNLGAVWETRAIVSADLVNSLNEACRTRQDWFQQVHGQLVTCRLGFYCDLYHLRQVIWRMHETIYACNNKRESVAGMAHVHDASLAHPEENHRVASADVHTDFGGESSIAPSGFSPTEGPDMSPTETQSPGVWSPSRASFQSAGQRSPSLAQSSRFGSKRLRDSSLRASGRTFHSDTNESLGALGSDSDAPAPVAVEVDLCPVYFFIPELYLDSYELENRDLAIVTFNAELEEEAKRLQELIEQMGVGNWKQLLQYFLRQGFTLAGVAREMVKACEDPDYVREIRNNFSNGLMDATDDLAKQAEELRPERDALQRKDGLVEHGIIKNMEQVYTLEEELRLLRQQRPTTGEALPSEEESRLKRQKTVDAKKKAMTTDWGSKEEQALAEFARLSALKQDWQTEVLVLDDGEKDMLQKQVVDIERKSRVLKVQLGRFASREEESLAKVKECQEAFERDQAEVARLRAKLASLPKADPVSLRLKRLQRELKDLHEEQDRLKEAMNKCYRRIKAMRVELRTLYKKLGWELDFSESESEGGDEHEMPYWKRRQLAADGFLAFDATLFAYAEHGFRNKRKAKRLQQHHAMVEGIFQAQMHARRILSSSTLSLDTLPRTPPITVNGKADRAMSFAASDTDATKSERPGTGGTGGTFGSGLAAFGKDVPWKHNEKEVAKHCTELVQLSRCAATFDAQLQRVAEHFLELLPRTGNLGRLREKCDYSLRELSSINVENSALGDDSDQNLEQSSSSERHAEALYKNLQDAIHEAITHGGEIHEIREAMRHAVVFKAIRERLQEVLAQVRQLRGDVRAVVGSEMSLWSSKSSFGLLDTMNAFGSSSTAAPGSPPKLKNGRLVQPFLLNTMDSSDMEDASGGLDAKVLSHMESTASRHSADEIDFGFRPDGVGEESLENWSLFKVSYGPSSGAHGADAGAEGHGRKVDTRIRRQRRVADGSFREYMSQREQGIIGGGQNNKESGGGLWKSPSMPALTGKQSKKGWCSLPQLVTAAKSGPTAGGQQAPARSPPPDHSIDKSWQFGNAMAPPAA
mmetsp:Transcript_64875/g.154914  ORF Transcript_64875/g.154914 Transcript_64875/m.154914 type:complete len:1079 (+) Transcript_64875:126-3362(+)